MAIHRIYVNNVSDLIEAGADLLAVINYLFTQDDVVQRTRRLTELYEPTINLNQPLIQTND